MISQIAASIARDSKRSLKWQRSANLYLIVFWLLLGAVVALLDELFETIVVVWR